MIHAIAWFFAYKISCRGCFNKSCLYNKSQKGLPLETKNKQITKMGDSISSSLWYIIKVILLFTSGLVEIRPVVTEKMFDFFSISYISCYFVQLSRTVWAILIKDLPKNYQVMLKSAQRLWRRCWLILFLFLALTAILCSQVKQFEQFLRNNAIKLGWNPPKGNERGVVLIFV